MLRLLELHQPHLESGEVLDLAEGLHGPVQIPPCRLQLARFELVPDRQLGFGGGLAEASLALACLVGQLLGLLAGLQLGEARAELLDQIPLTMFLAGPLEHFLRLSQIAFLEQPVDSFPQALELDRQALGFDLLQELLRLGVGGIEAENLP